jgi:hypothetical protein
MAYRYPNTGGEIMKSYKELGITFQEFGALLGVRCMLANKSLVHIDTVKQKGKEDHVFNLAKGCGLDWERGCGTVGCIGGTMALIMGKSTSAANDYVYSRESHPTLGPLFFPNAAHMRAEGELDYRRATPEITIEAIDNFLDGMPNPWTPNLLRKLEK